MVFGDEIAGRNDIRTRVAAGANSRIRVDGVERLGLRAVTPRTFAGATRGKNGERDGACDERARHGKKAMGTHAPERIGADDDAPP